MTHQHAGGNAPALVLSAQANLIYRETITALQSEIISKFGSVRAYCEQSTYGITRYNLSRVFNFHQDLALTTYCKICNEVGVLGRAMPDLPQDLGTNLTLRQYLIVDNHAITQSIFALCFDTNRNL